MKTCVVNVATGRYMVGQLRLQRALLALGEPLVAWTNEFPQPWPSHEGTPYGFKPWALEAVRSMGVDLLLWCDACIVPVKPLDALWNRIDREGYWMSHNGFLNGEWTADSALPDLFPEADSLETARRLNADIPHVVATAFGMNVRSPIGKAFLDEYYRLATETSAFRGPHVNLAHTGSHAGRGGSVGVCGPPSVKGHRHDQTAASVIAWRLGMKLTDPPNIFAYKGGETEETVLVADGNY